MKKYEGHSAGLVADIDCDADGKPLCDEHGVEGYPTIKWGDPSDQLETYEGGREYGDLLAFAQENLKPMCSPMNIDLCDEEKKAEIEKFMQMPDADLTAEIEKGDAELKKIEEWFGDQVEALGKEYEELGKAQLAKQEAVKEAGLGLMKAVRVHKFGPPERSLSESEDEEGPPEDEEGPPESEEYEMPEGEENESPEKEEL